MIIVFIALAYSVFVLISVLYLLIGDLMGAPFVPSGQKEISQYLKLFNLKPGKVFYDLGSGDGRVVRTAVKMYGVKGIGVEIHPWLVIISAVLARIQGLKNIKFLRKNFWGMDISDADYFYFYLTPKAMDRLGKKILEECHKGVVIVSKSFAVPHLENKLIKQTVVGDRKVFVYKI